jgi:hypothetical protein
MRFMPAWQGHLTPLTFEFLSIQPAKHSEHVEIDSLEDETHVHGSENPRERALKAARIQLPLRSIPGAGLLVRRLDNSFV